MTNEQVILELRTAAAEERKITTRVVELIAECLKRKLWAKRGFANAHAWLVREFGFADASAARRLDAARLLLAVPHLAEKLSAGEVTLTSISKAQTVFRHEEKRTHEKISDEKKTEILNKLENLSTPQAERVLAEEFPECHVPTAEKLKAKRNQTYSLNRTFTAEDMAELEHARELLSHAKANAGWAEIFVHLAKVFNEKNDPVKSDQRREERSRSRQIKNKGTHSAAKCTPIKRSLREKVIAKANGRCEFKDPLTGNICGSRTRLQVDHILPRAIGGTDELQNLRCLCATHNRLMAEEILGRQWANSWREQKLRAGP